MEIITSFLFFHSHFFSQRPPAEYIVENAIRISSNNSQNLLVLFDAQFNANDLNLTSERDLDNLIEKLTSDAWNGNVKEFKQYLKHPNIMSIINKPNAKGIL